MAPNPSLLPSQKRQSDSAIASESNHKKARLSSVSSETVKSEDKQRSEERAKSSWSSKEEKKQSKSKDNTISKYEDKREVRADQKLLKDDKKEVKKDIKDDKMEVKNDKKDVKDTRKKKKFGKKKMLVLPYRAPQFEDLFGPPIKLEYVKQKPSTISSEKQPNAASLKA
ncbi:hypothetical protein CHS0354_000306 [Potamilus streckersoni]|uniref:Uncharacterized protein n=1 Tax=Potamilus streckersoni TaxID=2493646 RepID=A0AAE0SA73_9BIVA|nr:hypothetical protein CHS0354_000306 [Potamilus streckersoni]